jgi:hypothetical protein
VSAFLFAWFQLQVLFVIHSAKYGLATLNNLLDVFGIDQAVGYDIGCVHKITVAASSISEKAQNLRLQVAVDAFHGHAHNRLCQLSNHPLFLKGFGLEDLATCERIFAGTNPATRLIRHASHFHWLQFLDLQMDQWDKDKYLELSKCYYFLIFFLLIQSTQVNFFSITINRQSQSYQTTLLT